MSLPSQDTGTSSLAVRSDGAPTSRRSTGPWTDGAVQEMVFGIVGALVGRRFTAALREMQHAQWLSTAALQARSEARLAALLQHAAEYVPFYRDLYRRLGLASDELRSITDLTRLPVVSKATYRQHPDETFLAGSVSPHRRLPWTTSGSTGEPFRFYLDREAIPLVFASHLFYDSWYGQRPFDRYVRLMTPPIPTPPLSADTPAAARFRYAVTGRLQALYEAWTQERISVWEVDGERAEAIYRRIEAFGPAFILGYTSTLATIADELLKCNLRLSRPVRGVITIAETLTPHRRRLIEQYFQAPIINRYGQREFKFWCAQSCSESPERFHVNTELVVWEIVREDGTPAAPGETGRLVLTNLTNYVMPFIRYDTGDLAAASTSPCACGRGFPLIGQLEGRSLECIRTPSGKVIVPVVLGQYLFVTHDYVDAIRHYQLIQEAPDRVRLLVVPAAGFDEGCRARLGADMRQLLGDDIAVTVDTVTAIPCEKSGKRPIIKHLTG